MLLLNITYRRIPFAVLRSRFFNRRF